MIPEEGTDEQLKDAVYNSVIPAKNQAELWLYCGGLDKIPSVFKTYSHNGVLVTLDTYHSSKPYTMTLVTFIDSVLDGTIRIAPHGTRFTKFLPK